MKRQENERDQWKNKDVKRGRMKMKYGKLNKQTIVIFVKGKKARHLRKKSWCRSLDRSRRQTGDKNV